MSGTPEFDALESSPTTAKRYQFSLRGMLLLITAVCAVLGASVAGGILGGYETAWLVLMLAVLLNVRPMRERAVAAASVSLLWLFGLVFVLAVLAAPSGTPSRRNICRNQMMQIGLAITNYEAQYGCYPPAYTVDASGRRLHSWRTLILPSLEENFLYNQLDLSQPWDAPANLALTKRTLSEYMCPGNPRFGKGNFTSYVAVTGPETMWPGERGRQRGEVTDGLSNTILIVEVARTDIAWAEPRDLTLDELIAVHRRGEVTGIASFHTPAGASTSFSDVHTIYLPGQINEETLRALFTVAGGEVVDFDDLSQPPVAAPTAEEPAP